MEASPCCATVVVAASALAPAASSAKNEMARSERRGPCVMPLMPLGTAWLGPQLRAKVTRLRAHDAFEERTPDHFRVRNLLASAYAFFTIINGTGAILTALTWQIAQPSAPARSSEFDVVITGGRVVDGTGAPWFRGRRRHHRRPHRRDRRSWPRRHQATRIDAARLVIAPGFIDMMGSQSTSAGRRHARRARSPQGITTEVTGEGSSIAPLNDRRCWRRRNRTYAYYGVTPELHDPRADTSASSSPSRRRDQPRRRSSAREACATRAWATSTAPPPRRSCEPWRRLVAQAMEQGAMGVSAPRSLRARPLRLDRRAHRSSRRWRRATADAICTHQRSESNQIIASLDEAFAVAERAHIPTEVWHLKTAYRANWGRMPEILRHIEAARARGLDVSANQYPYTAPRTGSTRACRYGYREGGTEPMLQRLKDPRPARKGQARHGRSQPEGLGEPVVRIGRGGRRVAVVGARSLPRKWEGKTLAEIGKEMGKDPRDAVMDLVIADRAESSVIISIMREDDVRTALAHPLIAIGTDSGARAEDGPLSVSKSHPRAWGSFHADPRHVRARRAPDDARGHP